MRRSILSQAFCTCSSNIAGTNRLPFDQPKGYLGNMLSMHVWGSEWNGTPPLPPTDESPTGIFRQVLFGCYIWRQIEPSRTKERQSETKRVSACIKGISGNRLSHQGLQRSPPLLSRLRHHTSLCLHREFFIASAIFPMARLYLAFSRGRGTMSSCLCQGERRKQYFDDIWASRAKNGLVPRLPYCGLRKLGCLVTEGSTGLQRC
jgi:hypothetical protein